jgi:hypothetical protein
VVVTVLADTLGLIGAELRALVGGQLLLQDERTGVVIGEGVEVSGGSEAVEER